MPTARWPGCPVSPRQPLTCWPKHTPERRCASLSPDHAHDHDEPPERGTTQPPVAPRGDRALRIGIGGPVGSGKTALVAALCRALKDEVNLAVVTNDIYTTEDADFLRQAGVLDIERIS